MKKKKIILVILSIIIIFVGILIFRQWNNLQALRYAATYSEDELQEKLENNERAIDDILNKFPDMDISKLPKDAADMLNSGEITEDEAIAIITGNLTLDDIKAGKTASSSQNTNLKNLIAKVYVLRSTYTGKLNSLVSQAYAEYTENGRNISPIADKYIALASDLEAECDSQMETLLSQIKEELDKKGESHEIISQIRSTYKSEKSIKKGELLSKYKK